MSDTSTLKIAIIGASGYTGGELASLLLGHPHVGEILFGSRGSAGAKVAEYAPALRGRTDAVFMDPEAGGFLECDAVFFATPHGVAMNHAESLINAGVTVIDLSPDFRLRDEEVFRRWYGEHSSPALLSQAVYGLTESARAAIKTASIIACPGCFATAVELALIPLAAAGVIAGTVMIDAKSGVSGAGKRADRADLLFAEQSENFKAYAVGGHRHHPEIEQAVSDFAAPVSPFVFMPHLLPTVRGIYATVYAPLLPGADCAAAVRDYWRDEMFIDVLEEGVPEIAQVSRTNRAQLSARNVGDVGVVFAALDNLQKGAAGQAVQNMNVRFGLSEAAGLTGARHV